MKYKQQITKAFNHLGYIPINGQEEAVNRILTAFFDNHKANVVLSADTGTGKSIIGAVVAQVFEDMNGSPSSFILMHTNSLVKQYQKTFQDADPEDFFQIIGSDNYPCEAARSILGQKDATAEMCINDKLSDAYKKEFCNDCEFKKSRRYIQNTSNIITNYSYYLISKMWSKHLPERQLSIFDEAHTINDIFSEHNAIVFSKTTIENYIKECADKWPKQTENARKQLTEVYLKIKSFQVTDDNYFGILKTLGAAYKDIASVLKTLSSEQGLSESVKTSRAFRKYFGLGCKIGDLFTYKYEHVFDFDKELMQVSVKPLFIGNMAKVILSNRNLFMSATISDQFVLQTMNLPPDSVEFIKLDPVYPPENKKVVYCDPVALSYETMKDPKVIKTIKDMCNQIVNDHDDQKGLILVPSFKLGGDISSALTTKKVKIFSHKSGEKIEHIMTQFKKHVGPAVLISPSIFEGLDFPGDLSRYQIIVKAPYPSLAEKRIKIIATKYGDIYRLLTLKKIVQGIGRSVRSADDWAVCYILDKNATKLFDSSLNVWKNQFFIER